MAKTWEHPTDLKMRPFLPPKDDFVIFNNMQMVALSTTNEIRRGCRFLLFQVVPSMCLPFVWFYCCVFVQACFEYVSERIKLVHSSWSFVIESLSLSVPFLCVGITREPQLYFSKRQLDFGELPLGTSSHFPFKSKPNTARVIPPIHITSFVSYKPAKLVIMCKCFIWRFCRILQWYCLF